VASLVVDQGLEFGLVDMAVSIDDILEQLRVNLSGLAAWQVDGAGGEVDRKGDQARDHEEQNANGVQAGDQRVDLAFDLPTAIWVENRAAGGQLGEQGDGDNTANNTGFRAHGHLQGKSGATIASR